MNSLRNQFRTLFDPELQILRKHFEIKRKRENVLGKGGFGVVWRGVDKRNNKAVAVKVVPRKPETQRISERELRFLRECNHPNIIKLIDFDKDNSSFFFILEFCTKGNLDEFVKDRDIDFRVCLRYMLNISSGLKFMHSQGIGHRDIKPTNVLVKNDQCLGLADFGLSRELSDSTSASATGGVGSLSWMAPEVLIAQDTETSTAEDAATSTIKRAAHRHKYGLSIDIFSLGLLFLSLLTHRQGMHLTPHTGMHFAFD